MIDLHTHILPGLDDGARTWDDSLAMARAAVADGIETLAATPHVRDDYPTDPATMERLVGELRARLEPESVALEVLTGGELALDRLSQLGDDEIRRFTLAGTGAYVLLEFPYFGWPLVLRTLVPSFLDRGVVPVLAHPERNGDVQAVPELLRPIVDAGALVQITAASVDGRLGSRPAKTAARLLELGLAHLLASDAHAPELRGIGLSAAAAAIGDPALERWLTVDAPAAIVAGQRIPERPAARPRRFLRR